MKRSIINISRHEFIEFLKSHAIPKFRADQVYKWIYKFGKVSFFEMRNIGNELQNLLDEEFYITSPSVADVKKSVDGTIKFLLKLRDSKTIEVVYMPNERRNTICISSQVGCAVGCTFCHTGTSGFERNLDVEEIVSQYIIVSNFVCPSKISNIVFMGMGEPLYNVSNVLRAIDIFIGELDDSSLSRRKITVSTSGITPVLSQIAESLKCRLAISLHAPNNSIRSRIMPINDLYNIQSIVNVCRIYSRHRPFLKITFEYLLLDGINDSDANAVELVSLLKEFNSKVNIIQFNPFDGCLFKPSKRAKRFASILERSGIDSPIRERRGADIMAACGQLKSSIHSILE